MSLVDLFKKSILSNFVSLFFLKKDKMIGLSSLTRIREAWQMFRWLVYCVDTKQCVLITEVYSSAALSLKFSIFIFRPTFYTFLYMYSTFKAKWKHSIIKTYTRGVNAARARYVQFLIPSTVLPWSITELLETSYTPPRSLILIV